MILKMKVPQLRKRTEDQKNYICKHLVLQAIRSKYISIPLSAHTNEFQDAPKRGRPSIVSKALQVDTPINKRKASQTPAKSKPKNAKKLLLNTIE